MKGPRARMRIVMRLVAVVAVLAVAFLALRPSPWMGEVPWIPRWVGEWADRHGNFRNCPAFAGLAAVLLWPLGWRQAGVASAVLAVGLESAQWFISGRTFDWADIGWSLAGVAAVTVPASVWRYRGKRNRPCSQATIPPTT